MHKYCTARAIPSPHAIHNLQTNCSDHTRHATTVEAIPDLLDKEENWKRKYFCKSIFDNTRPVSNHSQPLFCFYSKFGLLVQHEYLVLGQFSCSTMLVLWHVPNVKVYRTNCIAQVGWRGNLESVLLLTRCPSIRYGHWSLCVTQGCGIQLGGSCDIRGYIYLGQRWPVESRDCWSTQRALSIRCLVYMRGFRWVERFISFCCYVS